MNYSFEYIDIILLAMIAGFIFLTIKRNTWKKNWFEGKLQQNLKKNFQKIIKEN